MDIRKNAKSSKTVQDVPSLQKLQKFYPLPIKNMDIRKSEKEKIDPKNHLTSENICSFQNWVTSFSFRKKTSLSDSSQIFATIKENPLEIFKSLAGKKVFLKAFPEILSKKSSYGDEDNSLEREVMIMRYLSYLHKYSISPCITRHIADFACEVTDSKTIKNMTAIFKYDVRKQKEFQKNPMVRYLLTEYLEGQTLGQWILSRPSLEDFKSVIFQILYTCYQFYLAGIKHNDLHGNNIIVVENKIPRPFLFITKDYSVKVSGRFTPKIFDFDRAVFYKDFPVKTTGLKQLCKEYGSCPEENYAADSVNILTAVYSSLRSMVPQDETLLKYMNSFTEEISSDPENMIRKSISKYKASFPGLFCLEKGSCTNWIPSEDLFNTFNQMVEKNAFRLEISPHISEYRFVELVEKQLSFCARTFTSLDVDDEKRKILISRTNFPFRKNS